VFVNVGSRESAALDEVVLVNGSPLMVPWGHEPPPVVHAPCDFCGRMWRYAKGERCPSCYVYVWPGR
jgi:hypothetical protein